MCSLVRALLSYRLPLVAVTNTNRDRMVTVTYSSVSRFQSQFDRDCFFPTYSNYFILVVIDFYSIIGVIIEVEQYENIRLNCTSFKSIDATKI